MLAAQSQGTEGWIQALLWIFGIGFVCIGFAAYGVAYEKMTIDVTPGAYVTICNDVPKSSGLAGNVLKSHVGQVQGLAGGGRITVQFPPREDAKGQVLGGTFDIKKPILRQSTAEKFNAQPLAQQEMTYAPPTLEQQEMVHMPQQAMVLPQQAMVLPQPSAPTVPPHGGVVEDSQPQAPASLSDFLASARLEQYEQALRDLGATEVADLAHVDEAACMEIGMKKIEIKRLLRVAQ